MAKEQALRHAKESKKKPYQEPVLTDLGHGSKARERIIDLAISKGISSQDLNRLLSELQTKKTQDSQSMK
jgi:hypothetical protein